MSGLVRRLRRGAALVLLTIGLLVMPAAPAFAADTCVRYGNPQPGCTPPVSDSFSTALGVVGLVLVATVMVVYVVGRLRGRRG